MRGKQLFKGIVRNLRLPVLNLFNRGVIFLEGLHFAMTLLGSGNTLHGIVGTSQSGDVRNLVLDAFGVRTAVRS